MQTILTLLKILIQPEWAPQARGTVCLAHAAQSIATPLIIKNQLFPLHSLLMKARSRGLHLQ